MTHQTKDAFESSMTGEVAQEAAGLAVASVAQCLKQMEDTIAALEAGHPQDRIPLEHQRYSVGYVCQTLGLHPSGVRMLLNDVNATFVSSINGVPHIDGHTFAAIAEEITTLRQAVAEERRQKEAAK